MLNTLRGMRDKKGEYRVWRRFKVSAGIGLSAFQDKVVAPIMGWCVSRTSILSIPIAYIYKC